MGLPLPPNKQAELLPQQEAARERTDDEAWRLAWSAGQTMSLEEAVEVARQASS